MARCATGAMAEASDGVGAMTDASDGLSPVASGSMREVDTFLGCTEVRFFCTRSFWAWSCSSPCAGRSVPFASVGSENLRGIKSEMLATLAANLEIMAGPDSEYVTAGAIMIRKIAAIA